MLYLYTANTIFLQLETFYYSYTYVTVTHVTLLMFYSNQSVRESI